MPLLPSNDWTALLEGIVRKKYQILLGAGFSLEVEDRLGRSLPGGDDLRDELIAEFGLVVSPGERVDLSRAYQAARRRLSVNGQTLEDWLRFRFTETTPPVWYSALRSLPTQCIWTLNIDDAVERSDPSRFRAVTFADKHKTFPPSQVPVVHLHGSAREPEKGLIFSIQDYRGYVDHARSYALQFEEELSDGPVIVVGAALYHETDLAQALSDRARNVDARWPSIAVMPSPSDFQREEFAAWGLTVVDATAEQFLNEVQASSPAMQRNLAPQLAAEQSSTPLTVRFSQQWSRFEPTQGARTKYREFLNGAEPLAIDVQSGRTITRDLHPRVLEPVLDGASPVLLHGGPFSGKSTLILAVGLQLHQAGWQVFQYNGVDRLDSAAVLSQATLEPHTLLLVDDAALIADDLRHLLESAEEEGVSLHLLCADRTGPASRLLRWGRFEERSLRTSLSPGELEALVALLQKTDLLNKRWRTSRNADTTRDLRHRNVNDFASVICELVIGEQFEERVRRDYRSLTSDLARGAYLLGCVLARVTRGAPIGLVASAFGTTGHRVEVVVGDLSSMESVCTLTSGRVRPRHRRHAEILLEKVATPEELFWPLVGLARALAPSLDVSAIKYETLAYRISVAILDQESLAELIGRHRLERFYAEIEDGYSWNSRFWEQRALAAAENRDFEPAMRFSRMALQAHRDAFSLNTSSSIRLKSLWADRFEPQRAQDVFWEIVPDMRESRNTSRPDSEYPYVTFFSGCTRLARQLRSAGAEIDRLILQEFRDWESAAERSLAFRDPLGMKKLHDFKWDWLRAAVTEPDQELDSN